jgi:hypothetical protein
LNKFRAAVGRLAACQNALEVGRIGSLPEVDLEKAVRAEEK